MELICEINIDSEETRNPNRRGWVHNIDYKTLEKIARLGFELEARSGGSYYACKVRETAASKRIHDVREILNSSGLIEHTEHTILPEGVRRTHYAFNYIRQFVEADIDAAEYLRMNINGLGYIASWADTTCDGYVLRVDKKQKSGIAIGWLDLVITPFASDDGRQELERYTFKGLQFCPAIFDAPGKVTKPLYMMTSSVTLPRCLLPIQNGRGHLIDSTAEEGERIWDDAGRFLPILRFNRHEMDALGEFDFAQTRELIGGRKEHYRHHYIVSQQFRAAIKAGKHRWVAFVPVEVV